MVDHHYLLKDGSIVEAIPIGKAKMIIGEKSPDGMLEICDRGPNFENPNKRGARCICKCICGNYTLLGYSEFKNGITKSCGCWNKKIRKELCAKLGKKKHYKDYASSNLNNNPYYIFIQPTEEETNLGLKWKIKCRKCGNEFIEVPNQLVSNTRRKGNNPCSCWRRISKGVLKILNILEDNNISYVLEQSFKDCLSPKNNLLKFDFYINNEYLIEYDGEQHFIPTDFHSTVQDSKQENFEKYKKYDKIKNEYCFNKKIPLIRIPYTHYNNIELKDLLLETSEFIVKEEENE